MKKMHSKSLLIFLLALSCSTLGADTYNWVLSPDDSSYKILTFFFGTVSDELICLDSSCSYLMPQLMAVFNQGFIAFGAVVLSFVMMTSTAASAHEGEFLGKKMSSMGTPLRLLLGSGLLIPTQTGYSQLQIMIMKMILFGVMLGNNTYAALRSYVEGNNVTFAMEKVSEPSSVDTLNSVASLSSTIYRCEFCYAYVQDLINNKKLTTEDAARWGLTVQDTMNNGPLYFECDSSFYGNAYTIDAVTSITKNCTNKSYLVPNPNVCGTWAYYFSENDPNPQQTQLILTELEMSLREVAQQDVAYLSSNQYKMSYSQGRPSAEAILQSIALTTQKLNYSTAASQQPFEPNDGENDWLYFPKNFYTWLRYGSSLDLADYINPLQFQQGDVENTNLGLYSPELAQAKSAINQQKYFDQDVLRNKLYQGDSVADYNFVGRDGGPISYTFNEIAKMMKDGKEPLVTLTKYGLKQLTLAFDMLMTAMIMGSTLVLAGSIWSSISPGYGSSVVMAFTGFIQNFFMAFGFLIPLGVGLGIYLPLVPIMTYTGAVMGWFMMVIEVMVAAPIIALGLMSPGEGQSLLGRAQPAFLMLIRLMIGPALIVIGLVLGAKMFDIFASYFTQIFIYGFAYVTGTANYGAWVGLIFIPYFFFYGTFMVGLGVRCYSMTYLLLDKSTSWIGGQTGGSAREMQQILDEAKSGAEQGGSEMQGQTQKVSDGIAQMGKDVGETVKKDKG